MANALKTTDLVLKRAVTAFLNQLMLAEKVNRQFDKDATFSGKIGATAKVRRPVYFEASQGATITSGQISDIEEATIDVTLDQREKVVIQLSSQELALNIQNEDDLIEPAMEELAQKVETYLAGLYSKVSNFVGTPSTTPATQAVVNAAKQKLDELGVPMQDRSAFYDPAASNALAAALSGVFPIGISKKAIEEAAVTRYSAFDIFMNQSLAMHTVGAHGSGAATGTPLVNGASQEVTYATSKDTGTQSLITDGWTASTTNALTDGDVFTIANVFAVNRRTRVSTGVLQQFVARADVSSDGSGDATFTISPPMITSGPYQTVDSAPANDAAILVVSGVAATQYRQNLAFHKNAFTLAFGKLKLPTNKGAEASAENFKGISLRVVSQYDITFDTEITRFDVFFGAVAQNPDFAVRTTG